jgi:hypothetical protein
MRRARLKILGLVAAAVLPASAVAASSQDPHDEKRAIVPTDQAAVRSIVIQPSDVPSWKPFGRYPPAGEGCPKFDPDLSSVTITGEHRGRQFAPRKGAADEAFTSAAWAYESAGDALTEWKAYTSRASVECTRDQIADSAPPGSINVTARAVPLRLPRVAPRQFARRYKLLWFTAGGDLGTVVFDDILLGRDRAEVSLLMQRVGPPDANPTASVERQLVRLLGQRLAREFP